MAKNKKRTNDGAGADSSSSPPLKRQKIAAASSFTAVSTDEMAAQILQLQQRLQSSEDEIARLQERLQQQEEENNQRLQLQQDEVLQPLQEENQRLRQFEEAVHKERFGPSWNGKTTDVHIIDNLTRLSLLAVHYSANVTNQFIYSNPS